jgi:hypothetical protein
MPVKRQYFPEMVIFSFARATADSRIETGGFHFPFV